MKIAVCLKRVADTTSKIVIGADGKSIDEAGLKFVPNPYDEFAVEEALALKEKAGAEETVVYSLGGDSAAETLRTARGAIAAEARLPRRSQHTAPDTPLTCQLPDSPSPARLLYWAP